MSDEASETDQLIRLALRLASGAQGAIEQLLAPGGVVESVALGVAGFVDELARANPEVADQVRDAAASLGRAWAALIGSLDQTTAPSSSESLPLDLATSVTNPPMNEAMATGATHPGAL